MIRNGKFYSSFLVFLISYFCLCLGDLHSLWQVFGYFFVLRTGGFLEYLTVTVENGFFFQQWKFSNLYTMWTFRLFFWSELPHLVSMLYFLRGKRKNFVPWLGFVCLILCLVAEKTVERAENMVFWKPYVEYITWVFEKKKKRETSFDFFVYYS